VRPLHNPDFHWGNFLFVTDEDAADDASEWVKTFQLAFPEATQVAICLIRIPAEQNAWVAQGIDLELEEALTTRVAPRQTPLPEGYAVRHLSGEDWAQSVARSVAETVRTNEQDQQSVKRFAKGQAQARRALSDRDRGASFCAFADDVLVADLGIVRCVRTARYQRVGAGEDNRRRGLASHFLGVAARWAGDQGCDRWASSPRPPARPDASTAVSGSSRTRARPGVPQAPAPSRTRAGAPS
jgi:GNAT superfamily N-acetyltransferase